MSDHGSQIKSYLGISALVSFYGIASIAVIYFGPYIGLSYAYEIIIIALLLLTWPIAILINSLRNRRARKREAAEAAAGAASEGGAPPAAPVKGGSAPKRVYEELTRGAEEAVQWLRSTRLGGAKSSDALYALPWYVVAGPSAGGKTSLVLSSGLDFHALPSQRRAEMKIIRPTQHCEWRVTDSAVLLDTSGHYQGDGPARDEWIALTETVKKHRNNRALDGFLIAVNAARLIQSSDTDIEQQAKILRARLDELIQHVRVRFPVYLVFTHIDGLPGFGEFFRGGKGVNEVWGATIPLEKSANAHALFDLEFDHLYESLLRQRLLRLRVPAQPEAQLRVFDFPLRFAEKREKLGLFASALFRPNPFSESPLLRGFYFTANITAAAATVRSAPEEGEERTAKALGKGLFTDRFFKEVVLSDKDLAASFQASNKKPPRTGAILLTLGGLLLLLLLFGAVISFFANKRLVTKATERGIKVQEITRADLGKDVTKKDDAAARVEVEAQDALREQLVELEATPPIYMRFGFYAGNEMAPRLREIYYASVEQRFKKPTVELLVTDLRNFVAGRPTAKITNLSTTSDSAGISNSGDDILGRHYDLLKAYLMLSDPSRVEPTFLTNTLADYWKRTAPPETDLFAAQILDYYSRQLVRDDAPHIDLDDRLVAEVRRKLEAYPPTERLYKGMITDINAKANAISLDSVLEGRGGGALKGTYTVPGSYTINGYRNYVKTAIENAGEEISKEDWVIGQTAASNSKNQNADIAKLQSAYLRDYTDQWRKFVKGITVREFKTKKDAVETLKALSATDSPMERVMSAVAQNTHLSAKQESSGLWGWIKSWFSSSTEDDDLGGNTEVEKEFRPLFQFVASDPKKKDGSPMSSYRAAFRRVLDPLEAASDSQLQQASQSLLAEKEDQFGLTKAQQEVGVLLEGFKTAAATDTAGLLKQPLQHLRDLMFGGGSAQLIKGWEEQVYPKAHAVETGYPFTETGEASIADLANFLNPANGQFNSYFNQKLAPYLEDSQGQWRLKETSPVAFSDDFIKYLNNARRLQEALFANKGQQPEVGYTLTVQPVANTDVIVEIDGNKLETRGNSPQSATFSWPARSGSTSGVKITVVPADGTTVDPKTFPGTWGLFKMLDASARPSASGDQYELAWEIGTVQVHATLRPASTNNPFQRSLFKNLHAPQNLQK